MKMKTFFGIVITLLVGYSCQSKNNANAQSEKKEVEAFVTEFYTWYLDEIYLKGNQDDFPDFILVKNEYFALDTINYFQFLKKSKYFSEQFLINERNKIADCNKVLKQVSAKEVEDYAIPSEGILECRFMEYMQWVGCQGEEIDHVDIKKTNQIAQHNFEVIVQLCDEIKVTVSNYNSIYRIDKIVLSR